MFNNCKEINNYKGPPSSMECCSWRQTCCGGGCCEPILPNYYSSKQENVKCSQKAMAASTYGYTSWETTMNGTTMNSIPKSNETIAEKVLCSDVSKPTVCYGGKCDDKTMSQDSNTRNAKEYEETGNGMVSSSTIRYSDR